MPTTKSLLKRKNFIETEFLKRNNEKFGYKKFDFLYLKDSDGTNNNIEKLNDKINSFFNEK